MNPISCKFLLSKEMSKSFSCFPEDVPLLFPWFETYIACLAAPFTECHVLSFCSIDSQDSCDLYAATTQDFTVPLSHSLQSSERLRWKHNGVVIFDRKPNEAPTVNVVDVHTNGSLKLTKLDKSKAGKYTPIVYDGGKAKANLKTIYLCVLGR